MNKNIRYKKLSLYFIFTFFICLIVYRILFHWDVSVNIAKGAMRLFMPFIIGVSIAYFANPFVSFLESKLFNERKKLPRFFNEKTVRLIALIIAYVIFATLIALTLNIVIPQISDSLREIKLALPHYYDTLYKYITTIDFRVGNNSIIIDAQMLDNFLKKNLPTTPEQITGIFNRYISDIVSITSNIVSGILNVFLGIIISMYLLINKEYHIRYTKKIIKVLLPSKAVPEFFRISRESHHIFLRFILGKIVDSIIIGVMCFVILIIVKIPYPMLISLIVFITNMIPFFGPLIGGTIAVLFLIVSYPAKAFWFFIIILGLQQFDANFLGPKILGDSTGLSPFYVIFAVVLFGGLFGPIGMFIGTPLFAVLKNIFDNYIEKKEELKNNLKKEEEELSS